MSAPAVTKTAIEIAYDVARRGWRPIPLDHPANRRCVGSHRDEPDPATGEPKAYDRKLCERGPDRESRRGKHPVGGWATIAAAAPNEKLLRHYFDETKRRLNVAVATKASGLFVVDEDEADALLRLAADLGETVPTTYRVRTAKGWHYYWTAPQGVELGNASGVLKRYGMDVRGGKGNGGYVVAAGSTHHSGHVYTAEDPDADVAPLPDWILAVLVGTVENPPAQWTSGGPGSPRLTGPGPGSWSDDVRTGTADEFLDQYRRHCDDASTPGWRHSLFLAARDGWRLVALDLLDRDQLIEDLNTRARRVWGADLDARDRTIALTEARAAAKASPWELLALGGSKIERSATMDRTRTGSSTDREEMPPSAVADSNDAQVETPTAAELRERRIGRLVEEMADRDEARRRFAALGRIDAPAATTSLRELLARERTAPKYRIDGLWPAGGKLLITATKKAGKTTLVGNLVRCLADTDRFLARPFSPVESRGEEGYAVTPGRAVALLDFEMTEAMLVEWLGDQRIEGLDRVHVELMRGRTLDLRDDEVRGEWAAHLRSLDVGTLILDPIGPVLAALGLDENSNTDVGRFLAAIDALCREAGIDDYAVIHHAGHGEDQRARGASAFLGWPDAWWQITRDEDLRFLRAEGRDVDLPETALVFDRATRRLTLGAGNRASMKSVGDIAAIVDTVKSHPGAAVNDLKKLLRESDGWGTERVVAAAKAAERAGEIHTHAGDGRRRHHHVEAACERCPTLVVGE